MTSETHSAEEVTEALEGQSALSKTTEMDSESNSEPWGALSRKTPQARVEDEGGESGRRGDRAISVETLDCKAQEQGLWWAGRALWPALSVFKLLEHRSGLQAGGVDEGLQLT